ncbi:MAG: hypothetical protein KDD43_12790, partial [Bdellovibrionales bacterium]|nr:hypothetical protein [Bdellovibrionales bacterium]
ISRWWRVRGHLLRGIKITDEERKEFQPFWVQVDTSGQIHSEPWTPARTISSVKSGESQK